MQQLHVGTSLIKAFIEDISWNLTSSIVDWIEENISNLHHCSFFNTFYACMGAVEFSHISENKQFIIKNQIHRNRSFHGEIIVIKERVCIVASSLTLNTIVCLTSVVYINSIKGH